MGSPAKEEPRTGSLITYRNLYKSICLPYNILTFINLEMTISQQNNMISQTIVHPATDVSITILRNKGTHPPIYGSQPLSYGAQPLSYGAQPLSDGAHPSSYGVQQSIHGAEQQFDSNTQIGAPLFSPSSLSDSFTHGGCRGNGNNFDTLNDESMITSDVIPQQQQQRTEIINRKTPQQKRINGQCIIISRAINTERAGLNPLGHLRMHI